MTRLLEGRRADLVLIPCKAAGLSWHAVEAILRNRPLAHPIDEQTLKLACKDYGKLSVETAQRSLCFQQVRNKIGNWSMIRKVEAGFPKNHAQTKR